MSDATFDIKHIKQSCHFLHALQDSYFLYFSSVFIITYFMNI